MRAAASAASTPRAARRARSAPREHPPTTEPYYMLHVTYYIRRQILLMRISARLRIDRQCLDGAAWSACAQRVSGRRVAAQSRRRPRSWRHRAAAVLPRAPRRRSARRTRLGADAGRPGAATPLLRGTACRVEGSRRTGAPACVCGGGDVQPAAPLPVSACAGLERTHHLVVAHPARLAHRDGEPQRGGRRVDQTLGTEVRAGVSRAAICSSGAGVTTHRGSGGRRGGARVRGDEAVKDRLQQRRVQRRVVAPAARRHAQTCKVARVHRRAHRTSRRRFSIRGRDEAAGRWLKRRHSLHPTRPARVCEERAAGEHRRRRRASHGPDRLILPQLCGHVANRTVAPRLDALNCCERPVSAEREVLSRQD